MLFQRGETAQLYADIFPGAINPRPAGIPPGVKLRILLTDRGITVAWQEGSGPNGPMIGRMDIPMEPNDMQHANFRGGQAGGYLVGQGGGCNCGSRAVRNWVPYPGVIYESNPRHTLASTLAGQSSAYGVPPKRYTRVR
jgi:hypothetical protein